MWAKRGHTCYTLFYHSQKWCLKCMFFPPLGGAIFPHFFWKFLHFFQLFPKSVHQKKPKRSATHCIGLGEKVVALITLVLHGLEAGLARGEGGGVHGGHSAALPNAGRAVGQGSQGLHNSSHIADFICVSAIPCVEITIVQMMRQ